MTDQQKIKRNDPCPCGSGKKYKACCMGRDKAEQAERVAWERAVQDMRVALIGFAKEKRFVHDVAAALGLFWCDRYQADTAHLMSVDESLRFFDWFAHDYGLAGSGKRLVELYRAEVADALSQAEAAILDGWMASPPGSAFILTGVDREAGEVVLEDLFLPDRTVTVQDTAAARHGEIGQILLAHPLPGHGSIHLAGATVVLPASEKDGLCAFIRAAQHAYLEERPESTMAEFLRERGYLLTHYALQWADREHRPAVAADDPAVHKPGGTAVKKLIRWGQEHVQPR